MAFNNPSASLLEGSALAFTAVDHGLQAWTFDAANATGTYTLATAGTVYVAAIKVHPRTITNILATVTTAGSSLTASQCFAGLYQNGALIGTTADQSGVWNSTGTKTMALASPVTPLGGLVYAAFVFNGTTGPTLAAGAGTQGVSNVGLAAAVSRYGTANTSVTTALPATLATVSALAQAPWVGLS